MDLLAVLLVVCITAAAVARSLPDVDSDPPVHVYKTLQDIKICTKAGGIMTIKSITMSPNPPQTDKTLYVNITYESTKDILSGKIEIDLMNGDKPFRLNGDLCTILRAVQINCPIEKGNHILSGSGIFSMLETTKGITGDITATTNDVQFFCVDLDIKPSKRLIRS